jgi:hypothetical protein
MNNTVISENSNVLIAHGEGDITWSPLLPALIKHVLNLGAKPSVLDVSGYSFPRFKTPPLSVLKMFSPNLQLENVERPEAVISERLDKPGTAIEVTIPKSDLEELAKSTTSMLITLFSDVDPKRHRILEPVLRRGALKKAKDLYRRARVKFSEINNLTVLVPNGRFPYQKAIELAARREGAQVFFFERGFRPTTGYFLGIHQTQDRIAWQERVQKSSESGSVNVKNRGALDWLAKRRLPDSVENEFTNYWQTKSSQEAADSERDNFSVAFFTSSQDEFIALDGWQGFGWSDQYSAFLEFSKHVNGKKVLRIHPNFINKSFGNAWEEMKRIVWFANSSQISKIVWPNDPVNSYNLMDQADRIFVHGSTVGLEASANSLCVWNSGNSIYDIYADVRNFEPGRGYRDDFFMPWVVNKEKSLEIIEEMLDADIPFADGIVSPIWNSSNIPIMLRVYNLFLVGSVSYFLLLVQKSISIRVNKLLVLITRTLILRNKDLI